MIISLLFVENVPKRKTDGSIAVDLKRNFLKLHFKEKCRILIIWMECECGMPIGYTPYLMDKFKMQD